MSIYLETTFFERLKIDKGVVKQIILPHYDMLDELKKLCIKISLLQTLKETPIFVNTFKELSTKGA